MVPTAVDDIQSAAAVRVAKRHLARSVAAGVRDVIAGSDVTPIVAYVSVNGCEVDAFLGVARDVGVSETHRLSTSGRAGATQYGAAGSRRSEAGSLQPLWYVDMLWLTGGSSAATC